MAVDKFLFLFQHWKGNKAMKDAKNLQRAGRFSELHFLPLQLSESDPNPDTGSKQNNKLLTEAHLLNPVL